MKPFWGDFGRRCITTFIIAVVVILLIAFSQHRIVQYITTVVIAFLAGGAVWEYCSLVKAKRKKVSPSTMVMGAILLVFSFFLSSHYVGFQVLSLVLFFLFFLIFFFQHFHKVEDAITEVAISTFGLIYIAVPLGMILPILYGVSNSSVEGGRWWLAFLLIVTKITDIAAYFGGKILGKNKLAATISPNKTKEGAFVGFIFALGTSFCFACFGPYLPGGGFYLSTPEALILGGILGIVGQLGDLAESLLKRDAKLKDSNRLPGLGGILDTVDSLLFNIPIIYLFLNRG